MTGIELSPFSAATPISRDYVSRLNLRLTNPLGAMMMHGVGQEVLNINPRGRRSSHHLHPCSTSVGILVGRRGVPHLVWPPSSCSQGLRDEIGAVGLISADWDDGMS